MKALLTNKEIVQDVLRRLPDDASLHDIAQELEFIAAVREGLSEFDEAKDSISIERVEPRVPSWVVTIGRQRRGRQKRATRETREGRQKAKAGDSAKSHLLNKQNA